MRSAFREVKVGATRDLQRHGMGDDLTANALVGVDCVSVVQRLGHAVSASLGEPDASIPGRTGSQLLAYDDVRDGHVCAGYEGTVQHDGSMSVGYPPSSNNETCVVVEANAEEGERAYDQ